MVKQLVLIAFLLNIAYVFATSNNASQPISNRKVVNKPTYGSKQGSNQLFGEPKLKGQSGQRYYSNEERKNHSNPPAVGSKQGSNQVFGDPKVKGENGQKYYSSTEYKVPQNPPTVGSKQGSNQIFGNPGSN